MKYFFTVISLFCFCFILKSQPLEMYGCHMRHKQANTNVNRTIEDNLWSASVERSDSFDILDYDLTIDLRKMTGSLLVGKAVIEFTPKISGLNFIPLDLLKLSVDSVFFESELSTYSYNNILLKVDAPMNLQVGTNYKVTIYYQGKPTTSSSGFGGFYFEDGIAYNLGIGLTDDPHNYGRSWFPCFDNFVERSTYTYRIITTNNITSYSVGALESDEEFDSESRIRTFRMNQIIPTYLSAIAASTYTVHEYIHNAVYGDLPVQLISKPADQANVKSSFRNLNSAVDALESWYGKYPFERVGYVMTTRGAMEHPNCIAFPVSSTNGGGEARRLMSHELCHLWWGDLLTLKTQADMWIKEGNAEYGSHLFEEYLAGRSSFEKLITDSRLEVIKNAHIDDGRYLPLSPMPKDITYGTTTYKKGAMVMHSLRGYLGDDLFRTAQQKVLEDYAYSNLTANIYRDALSAASGIDLTDFFNRWVFDIGFYDFVIQDFHALDFSTNTHEITIKQKLLKSNGFLKDAPVSITFVDQDNKLITQKVLCTGEVTTIPLKLTFNPKAVFINAPLTLNLAQFNSLQKNTKKGSPNFTYSNLIVNVTEIQDSTWAYAEHHYTAPDASLNPNVKMNDLHFWKLTIADPELITMIGKIEYNTTWDSELLKNGEDSIQLFYRATGTEDWLVYPFYTKSGGSASDKKGSFVISKYLQGEYATGNIDPAALSNLTAKQFSKLSVYPNPTTGKINLELGKFASKGDNNFNISFINTSGEIVYESNLKATDISLDLPTVITSGSYQIVISSENGEIIAQNSLIVLK